MPYVTSAARRGARAGRRGLRLHEARARPDRALGAAGPAAARHRRLRPQRHPRRSCAASSRSMPSTSPSPRSPSWRAGARSPATSPPVPCASSASTPRAPIHSAADRSPTMRRPIAALALLSMLLPPAPAAATCGGGGGGGLGGVSSGGLAPEVYRVPWKVLEPAAAPTPGSSGLSVLWFPVSRDEARGSQLLESRYLTVSIAPCIPFWIVPSDGAALRVKHGVAANEPVALLVDADGVELGRAAAEKGELRLGSLERLLRGELDRRRAVVEARLDEALATGEGRRGGGRGRALPGDLRPGAVSSPARRARRRRRSSGSAGRWVRRAPPSTSRSRIFRRSGRRRWRRFSAPDSRPSSSCGSTTRAAPTSRPTLPTRPIRWRRDSSPSSTATTPATGSSRGSSSARFWRVRPMRSRAPSPFTAWAR